MKNLILKLFLFSLLFIKGGDVFAAGDYVYIAGDVKDKSGILLTNVTVIAIGEGEKPALVEGITDNDGRYQLDLKPGKYKITFSAIGYETQTIEITIYNSEKGEVVIVSDVVLEYETSELANHLSYPIISCFTKIYHKNALKENDRC